jgi:glycosyltransferase involved in cell wall biosynthesis
MNPKIKKAIKTVIPANVIRNVRSALNQRVIREMGRAERTPFARETYPMGINLIGSFSQDSGLGQSCRLTAKEIERSGIPHAFIDFAPTAQLNRDNHEFDDRLSSEYTYGINLFHINMHEFHKAWQILPEEAWKGHYNIAFWLWEMQEFPEEWVPMIHQLDEIWTPAEFVSEAVRRVTDKPVLTVPYTVEAPYEEAFDRNHFHLPEDRFLYLMLFDSNSISERKNPYGVIEAYKQAFTPEDNTGLVIKIGNAGEKELEELRESLAGYNVYFVREMLPKKEVNSLIRCCNVYVSLHRSEGYGLVLAEAMMMGVPTIATNYSANTEFQDDTRACMIPYTLRQVGKDLYPYKKEYFWAVPDTARAAQAMRKLYEDREFYAMIRKNAYDYMHAEERISEPVNILKKRTEEIYEHY